MHVPGDRDVLDHADNLRQVDVEDVLPEPGRALHERLRARAARDEQSVLEILAELRVRATDRAEFLVLVDRSLELRRLALERSDVLLPLAALARVLVEQLAPLLLELVALLLCLVATRVPGLIEALAEMCDERVDPTAHGRVLLDVDAAIADRAEETVERLAASEPFESLAQAANAVDQVLLGGRIVDECVEVGRLVHVAGCVERAVDPLLSKVEDRGDGLMVVLVVLRTVAYLSR